ncbi:MAG: VOC family protein [Paracoccaceae bacterium]
MAVLNRILLYTKDIPGMVAFYSAHFGYRAACDPSDRVIDLVPATGGAVLMLHPAAKGQKQGQVQCKLVFDVADVAVARHRLLAAGVAVGPVLQGDGYGFANLKDPSGNALSISERWQKPPAP